MNVLVSFWQLVWHLKQYFSAEAINNRNTSIPNLLDQLFVDVSIWKKRRGKKFMKFFDSTNYVRFFWAVNCTLNRIWIQNDQNELSSSQSKTSTMIANVHGPQTITGLRHTQWNTWWNWFGHVFFALLLFIQNENQS